MYYFIVNPASSSGRGLTIWNTIKEELDACGAAYRFFLLSRPGEARIIASSLDSRLKNSHIIAVGGDGTINEIIDGLFSIPSPVCENITLGCIPTGSGNDFVRGLGLLQDPHDALRVILHPRKMQEINIGRCICSSQNALLRRFFAVSSGAGFDASVCRSVSQSKLKQTLNFFRSGKLVYLATALWQIFTMKRQTLQITVDDKPPVSYKKAYFAAAMNLPYEGGGFRFCPDAQTDDDFIDLFIANDISRLRALIILPLALLGKHTKKKGIHIVRCEKATIQSDQPIWVHTDGEVQGDFTEVYYTLCQKRVSVIVR